MAELSRKSLSAPANTSGLLYFTADGWLPPVVDPHSYPDQGQHSPEGEAFAIAMQAAWQDWVADGTKDANACPRSISFSAYVSFIVYTFILLLRM